MIDRLSSTDHFKKQTLHYGLTTATFLLFSINRVAIITMSNHLKILSLFIKVKNTIFGMVIAYFVGLYCAWCFSPVWWPFDNK